MTLVGYHLPAAVDWVPLLLMSITVGFFEAVFFRGFIQGTLEAAIGAAPAVLLAAGLYALYHVGYGMGGSQMGFLFGLGVVYAVAYRITTNVLIIWPLLTPLGGFFNQLQSRELAGQLPWTSMLGFGSVLMVMAVFIARARRHERRQQAKSASSDKGRLPGQRRPAGLWARARPRPAGRRD
jgi:membrane protease YdiL (CAAX protease family)